MPLSIVSDRNKVFTSNFWKELFALFDTKLQMSIPYYPRSDGQTEWVNQSLEMYLRCATNTQPQKWYNWLPLAEFCYNTSHHYAIGCSPFKALYKEEPHYGMLPDLNTTMNAEVKDFDEVLPRQCPCLWAFETWSICGIRRTRRRSDESRGTRGFTQVWPPW
jgi:hypothetical protein